MPKPATPRIPRRSASREGDRGGGGRRRQSRGRRRSARPFVRQDHRRQGGGAPRRRRRVHQRPHRRLLARAGGQGRAGRGNGPRAGRYQAAGCDGIFVPAASDPAAIRELAAGIALPLNVMVVPALPPVVGARAARRPAGQRRGGNRPGRSRPQPAIGDPALGDGSLRSPLRGPRDVRRAERALCHRSLTRLGGRCVRLGLGDRRQPGQGEVGQEEGHHHHGVPR